MLHFNTSNRAENTILLCSTVLCVAKGSTMRIFLFNFAFTVADHGLLAM